MYLLSFDSRQSVKPTLYLLLHGSATLMNLTYFTARQDKYIHSADIPKEIHSDDGEGIVKDKQTASQV